MFISQIRQKLQRCHTFGAVDDAFALVVIHSTAGCIEILQVGFHTEFRSSARIEGAPLIDDAVLVFVDGQFLCIFDKFVPGFGRFVRIKAGSCKHIFTIDQDTGVSPLGGCIFLVPGGECNLNRRAVTCPLGLGKVGNRCEKTGTDKIGHPVVVYIDHIKRALTQCQGFADLLVDLGVWDFDHIHFDSILSKKTGICDHHGRVEPQGAKVGDGNLFTCGGRRFRNQT